MASNQNHGTPLEDLSGTRGNSTNNAQGCMKTFIQRDYSEGTSVKFQSRFPQELEGKIEKSLFENTVNHINSLFMEAEKMSCSRYCEGCIGCITAYLIFLCTETHYEQMVKKVTKYVSEQNERIWVPRGLLLTNPVERGLRVVSFFNDSLSLNLSFAEDMMHILLLSNDSLLEPIGRWWKHELKTNHLDS